MAPDGGECTIGQNTSTAKFFGSLARRQGSRKDNFSKRP